MRLLTAPPVDGAQLATCRNISNTLRDVYRNGAAIERMYVFFSGHGLLAHANASHTIQTSAVVPVDVKNLLDDGSQLIDLNELPHNVTHHFPSAAPSVTDLPPQGLDLEALIAEIEVKLIEQALTRTRHSQKKAAHLLGLTARSLRYRLQKYGIGHAADLIEV